MNIRPRPTINYPKNCGHQACKCQARDHSSFCSDECERVLAPRPGAMCPCSHPGCAEAHKSSQTFSHPAPSTGSKGSKNVKQ
ncbi:MAG: hypothetical protein K0S79_2544 [Nitrospira sp.]|jgi:hypothetical protein|nr:hypothetical protein [Nitrospira sp.]